MRHARKNAALIILLILFSIFFIVSFVVFPDVGEKILYGKHPPQKKTEQLKYSQIILSGNYDCMESASLKAKGDLPRFVKEFNDCNN